MTDLLEEIQDAFNKVQAEHGESEDQVQIVTGGAEHMPPGFHAMQAYYSKQVRNVTRRGFRHHAGSTMPTNSDQLIERTRGVMIPLVLSLLLRTFSDGIRIGHQDEQAIKMAFHYQEVDQLFDSTTFVKNSVVMADGFAKDAEIGEFFLEYLDGGVDYLSHLTAFAHREVDPNKVWDVWVLVGSATTCSCYLAGYQLGNTWRERDVLDGIAIASEEAHGPE